MIDIELPIGFQVSKEWRINVFGQVAEFKIISKSHVVISEDQAYTDKQWRIKIRTNR